MDSTASGSSAYDLSREPEIVARVGEEFQAEFPQLVSRSEYLLLGHSEYSKPVLLPSSDDHRSTKSRKAGKGVSKSLSSLSVPLSEPASWTDTEKLSFLVGLYIFQKNFVQLAKFIETKSMGDIMAYYYGRFYRSQEYSRWSDKKKTRSRRCIHGRNMFRGARQQELLARLFSNVSEDCKTSLLEVSRSFSLGNVALQEYIFSMKGLVGLNLLVEAVGLGKGRQDLTGVTFEPSRASLLIQIRPEIPTGKACADLSVSEIVGYLTGDYRKSKSKFDDFFFGAVWPRLLERGWISEEPKVPGYPVSVHTKPFVFLVPGVSNIPRRKLVKGIHFYDSISDVLGKVAKDPSLIELETQGGECSMINNEGIGDTMLEEGDVPTRSRKCYLQPRTTTHITPGRKFTIVDASSDGEKAHMLKEMKIPRESIKPNPGKLVLQVLSDEDDVESDFSKKQVKHESVSQTMISLSNKPQPAKKSLRTEIQQKKAARKRFLSVPDVKDNRPVNKRARRLTVCHQVETSSFSEKPDSFSMQSDSMDNCSSEENASLNPIKADDISEPERSSHTSHTSHNQNILIHVLMKDSEGSNDKDNRPVNKRARRQVVCNHVKTSSFSENSGSEENVPTRASPSPSLIDDISEPERSCSHTSQNQPLNMLMDNENDVLMKDNLAIEVRAEPISDELNQQRRGTRNRPPTSRALEAIASGFFTVNSRGGSRSRSIPRPLKCRKEKSGSCC